jgi:hypothetical protein
MVFIFGRQVSLYMFKFIGDKYEGEWKACLRHGNGSDFFSNGDSYVG